MFDAGCTVSIAMESICVRDFWSMVTVKDRQLHYEKEVYPYVGMKNTVVTVIITYFYFLWHTLVQSNIADSTSS